MLDQTPHASRILQDLVSRDPQQGVSSFGQIPVAPIIMRTTFFGLMVFSVNLDDQLQRNTAEVGRVGRNRMFTTELLVSAPSITDHLPHGVRKLVRSTALVSRKRDCLRVSARSSSWAGGLVHDPPEFDSQRPAPSPPAPLPQTSLGERGARAKGRVSKWCSGLWVRWHAQSVSDGRGTHRRVVVVAGVQGIPAALAASCERVATD